MAIEAIRLEIMDRCALGGARSKWRLDAKSIVWAIPICLDTPRCA